MIIYEYKNNLYSSYNTDKVSGYTKEMKVKNAAF